MEKSYKLIFVPPLCEENNVNFSKVLQDALISKVQVK